MKYSNLLRSWVVALCLALGWADRACANTISVAETNLYTDFTVAGVGGMRNVGSGVITATDIHGPVTRAYLYWHGPMTTTDPTANAAVFVDGESVVGTNIGLSGPGCWPNLIVSQAYRADVTSIVTAKRNGTYQLTGFLKPGNININGASLIVFFDDGNPANNRDVVLCHGNDLNFHNGYDAYGLNLVVPGIGYITNKNSRAFIQMHAADGQVFPDFDDDALLINGVVIAPKGKVFSGDSVPATNNGPRNNGSLWDIKTWEISSLLNPGANSLSISMNYLEGGDCLAFVVVLVDLPAGSMAPKPESECIFIEQPPDIVKEIEPDKTTAVVTFPLPAVQGNCGGGTATCVPPSGSSFPLGVTSVICTATDISNIKSTTVFKVTVKDSEPPRLVCPEDIFKTNDMDLCSAVVEFTAAATDNVPGVILSCVPPSNSVFEMGLTMVNCTATDTSGNTAPCGFTVTVVDTEKPTFVRRADIIKSPDPDKTNAVVIFPLPAARDNCPGVTVTCAPPSGSTFPLGINTVTCTATDTTDNKNTTSFNVTVGTAPQILVGPRSGLVELGGTARLSVEVAENILLRYQWRFNNVMLPDGTNATLVIQNANPGDAGDYWVLVTNPFGSGLSASATLRVVVPPTLAQPSLNSPSFSFGYQTESNLVYVVEHKDSLVSPEWSAISTNTGWGNTTNIITVTNGRPSGFFRLRIR